VVVNELRELNVEAVAEAEYQHGECDRLRGDLELAEAFYERAASLGRDPQPGRALLLLARGEGDRAWSEVTDAVVRGSADPFRWARLLRAQVEIAVATDRPDTAAAAARKLRTLADNFGTPGFLAWADHATGLVALAVGKPLDAIEPLSRAADGYRRMQAWYDAASADTRCADAYGLLGDTAAEREQRDAAESAFRRLGIEEKAAQPDDVPPAGGLTAREVQVLRQVVAGRSNRDVARVLSISEATVRRHLANIYLKLGVSSRTAAAAWAHEQGLVPPAVHA
jgi:DNA-binding CsgD family transcriptional regulator